MKRVLYILGQLNDRDIEWMIGHGRSLQVARGEKLIVQGADVAHLYIILEGEFAIVDEQGDAREIARIGAGEVVGEMSFIDARPPAASVVAETRAMVFAIDRRHIKDKLQADPHFAARFYYAIALFLSERMRKTIGRMGYGTPQEELDEIDINVLNHVAQAGARFGQILNKFAEV